MLPPMFPVPHQRSRLCAFEMCPYKASQMKLLSGLQLQANFLSFLFLSNGSFQGVLFTRIRRSSTSKGAQVPPQPQAISLLCRLFPATNSTSALLGAESYLPAKRARVQSYFQRCDTPQPIGLCPAILFGEDGVVSPEIVPALCLHLQLWCLLCGWVVVSGL